MIPDVWQIISFTSTESLADNLSTQFPTRNPGTGLKSAALRVSREASWARHMQAIFKSWVPACWRGCFNLKRKMETTELASPVSVTRLTEYTEQQRLEARSTIIIPDSPPNETLIFEIELLMVWEE